MLLLLYLMKSLLSLVFQIYSHFYKHRMSVAIATCRVQLKQDKGSHYIALAVLELTM